MEKRLQTILAHAGITSRRHAAKLIEAGKVRVDGRPVTERGLRLDPDKHEIVVDGRPLPEKEKKYYFLFNKPRGVISTVRDIHARRKVTDFFKGIDARLYPVGRLDKDTTGALIITNDGELTHRLAHPRFGIEKEYRVTVGTWVRGEDIRKIEKGIELEGKITSPCEIKPAGRTRKGVVYRVRLHEGRKRQIRRMFESVGAEVIELRRCRYAGLSLGRLKEGEFRELTKDEVKKLRDMAWMVGGQRGNTGSRSRR